MTRKFEDICLAGRVRKVESFAVFLFGAALLSRLTNHFITTVTQSRDFDRAVLLNAGEWIWFGPETAGGNVAPGGLYYFLLAAFARLGFEQPDVFFLVAGLSALAVASGYHLLNRYYGREVALVFALILFTAPLFVRHNLIARNYSFLILPFVPMMIGASRAFDPTAANRRFWWVVTGFAAGAAVQMHFAALYPVLGLSFVQWLSARWGGRLKTKDFIAGAAAFGLTILPYLIWEFLQATGRTFGQQPEENLRNAEFIFARWLKKLSGQRLWDMVLAPTFSIPVLVVIAVLIAVKVLHRPSRDTGFGFCAGAAIRTWSVITAFAFIPALLAVGDLQRHADVGPLMLSFSFLGAVWIVGLANSLDVNKYYFLALPPLAMAAFTLIRVGDFQWWILPVLFASGAAAIWLRARLAFGTLILCFGAAAAMTYRPLVLESEFPPVAANMPSALALAQAVTDQTGWDWTAARERLFFFGWQYPRAIGKAFTKVKPLELNQSAPFRPDGYFVLANADPDDLYGMMTEMLGRRLPRSMAVGIQERRIEFGRSTPLPGAVLLPYFVRDRERLPPHFHNLGIAGDIVDSYSSAAPEPEIRTLSEDATEVSFRRCHRRGQYCGSLVATITRVPAEEKLHVRLDGRVGEILTPSNAARWGRVYINPSLSFRCAGAKTFSKPVPLFDSVALTYGRDFNHLIQRSYQLPVERWLTLPCRNKRLELIVDFESSRDVGKIFARAVGQSAQIEFR